MLSFLFYDFSASATVVLVPYNVKCPLIQKHWIDSIGLIVDPKRFTKKTLWKQRNGKHHLNFGMRDIKSVVVTIFLLFIHIGFQSNVCFFGGTQEKTKQSYCSIITKLPSNDEEAFKTTFFEGSDDHQIKIMDDYCVSEEQLQFGVMNYPAKNGTMISSQFFTCCSTCKLLREPNNLNKKLQLLTLKILFMTKSICIQTNKHFGFCEEYRSFIPQIWFSCPGLYSNQIVSYPFYAPCMYHLDSYSRTSIYAGFAIYAFLDQKEREKIFGAYDAICNPYRYGSKSDHTFSKNEFISDGHCVIRYKNRQYEVHCCCYWRFRHKCTIPLDGDMHVCANGTQETIYGTGQFIRSTLRSLPLGSSCFASFRLNVTIEETVHLVSTSYGVSTKNEKGIYRCHQYVSMNRSTQCSAIESCSKMCPLVMPFSVNVSQMFTVICCCDNRKDNMCNIKTDFGQNVLTNDKNYELTKCAHRHILQHIFFSDIYANNCIVYYDFSLMMPLNLIYGYNMEFERSAEEIFNSKEELIVADIFEYKNLKNTWTKCCTEINANKSQIDRISKSVKAWTVAVLKCNGKEEPRCDANLVERINKNRTYYFNYYQNKYGRLCYLKDFIEQRITQSRSLETTWCYEETYGRGLDFMNRRDFMLEDKKLPAGKICSHRLKTKIRYSNGAMFAYCFMMTRNTGETSTICCCSSIIDKPCNFISEKYHIEKTKVYYTRKSFQKREHCLTLDGRRDLCLLAAGEKVICYYIADMKNRKVEGGCALSLTRKSQPHKLANICLIKALYNLAVPVEFLAGGEAIKIFCCSGRDDCKESVLEVMRFKRFFETGRLKMIKTLKEEDFA
ncbi:Polyketide synthase PksN [Dirofilaria immitis]